MQCIDLHGRILASPSGQGMVKCELSLEFLGDMIHLCGPAHRCI